MSDFSVLILDKKPGETSFRSLNEVKRLHRGSKVGHTGTLDKFATGIMVVLTGEATKLNPLFSGMDKKYKATIKLGEQTDTLDPEGEIINQASIPTASAFKEALSRFTGPIKQRPPEYSAIHIDGKRAYERIRKGEEVVIPERDVTIYSLELLSFTSDEAVIDTHVSKGTYIRSLARDICQSAASCGYLKSLDRYQVGPFTRADITGLNNSLENTHELIKRVCPEELILSPEYKKKAINGFLDKKGIISKSSNDKTYYRIILDDKLFGIALKEDGRYSIIALCNRDNA